LIFFFFQPLPFLSLKRKIYYWAFPSSLEYVDFKILFVFLKVWIFIRFGHGFVEKEYFGSACFCIVSLHSKKICINFWIEPKKKTCIACIYEELKNFFFLFFEAFLNTLFPLQNKLVFLNNTIHKLLHFLLSLIT